MIHIEIVTQDGNHQNGVFEEGIRPADIVVANADRFRYPVLACRCDGIYARLDMPLMHDCVLEFKDLRDPYANMVYQNSLVLLYLKAVHDVLGKDVRVTIANSLSKGLFTRIHIPNVNDETAESIQARMEQLCDECLPINETFMRREQILPWLKENGAKDEQRLYEKAEDLSSAYLCTLADESSLFYVHAVPDTGYLKLFDVRRYRNGMLLRFPHPSDPSKVPVYSEQRLLYEAFSEETHWQSLMNVQNAADLNDLVVRNEYQELIMLSEALHEKKIAEIAEMIHSSRKRIILIAGPSSSGKTTFAKRLCIQLRVCGMRPLYLGTDDYFVDRRDMVPDEDGKLNFEDLSAVDIELFQSQMNDLLKGRKVDIPEFEFINGEKIFGKRITSIDTSQPIVIEGIHGLNPLLTDGIDDDQKFRIYISPLTQLNIDAHHRIPTTDARMLRRLVRDHRTRGRDAVQTIRDWPSVRAGEEKNIFPYNSEADVFFNSQCLYELAVLRRYALPLLESVTPDLAEYGEAERMKQFLNFFVTIEDDTVIAGNSIIREFIGGSVLVK